jgi:sulfite exporter TauE/SafE
VRSWLHENSETEYIAKQIIRGFLFITIPPMFVIPIYALHMVSSSIGKSIAVLVAFTLAFTILVLLATPAKPHEVLSVSAG